MGVDQGYKSEGKWLNHVRCCIDSSTQLKLVWVVGVSFNGRALTLGGLELSFGHPRIEGEYNRVLFQ